MNKTKTKRLSAQDMRSLLLKNAKTLMSNKYKTSAPELSGEKKSKPFANRIKGDLIHRILCLELPFFISFKSIFPSYLNHVTHHTLPSSDT